MAKLDHMIKYNGEFYKTGEEDPRLAETLNEEIPKEEPPKEEIPKDDIPKEEPPKEDKKTTK